MAEQSSARNERYRQLLDDEFLADVTFLVGEYKDPVKANKTILRFGSRVFCEMFDENAKGKEDNFYEVPDIEPEEFRKFLEYLYVGELKNDFEDAWLMLKGAMLYDEKDVAARCVKQLIDSISIDNCGLILSLAAETKSKELEDEAVKFILKSENMTEIFEKGLGIYDFSEKALLKIVPRDELAVDELKLFDTIISWGWCKQEIDETSSANTDNPKYLRPVLDNLIKHIRFPLMDPSDFSTKVDSTELLTVEETMAVLLCFNVKESERATYKARIFNSKPRAKKPPVQERTTRKCQHCNNIVAVGQLQTTGKTKWGVVPSHGQWYCVMCKRHSYN